MDLHSQKYTRPSVSAFVEEISGLTSQFDILRFMRRLTEAYGFRAFIVCLVPLRTEQELIGNTIITSWPSELLALFDQHKLLQCSPIARRLRSSTLPFTYEMSEVAKERGNEHAEEIFGRFGMSSGVVFPVHDQSGSRGSVSFAGDGISLDSQQTMELMYVAAHVFERLNLLSVVDGKPSEKLSERELDCLNWTAAGKTSAEIAEILGLSEHTVNHYLNRAAKKLDAVNRTQAVAKALRRGLIK